MPRPAGSAQGEFRLTGGSASRHGGQALGGPEKDDPLMRPRQVSVVVRVRHEVAGEIVTLRRGPHFPQPCSNQTAPADVGGRQGSSGSAAPRPPTAAERTRSAREREGPPDGPQPRNALAVPVTARCQWYESQPCRGPVVARTYSVPDQARQTVRFRLGIVPALRRECLRGRRAGRCPRRRARLGPDADGRAGAPPWLGQQHRSPGAADVSLFGGCPGPSAGPRRSFRGRGGIPRPHRPRAVPHWGLRHREGPMPFVTATTARHAPRPARASTPARGSRAPGTSAP